MMTPTPSPAPTAFQMGRAVADADALAALVAGGDVSARLGVACNTATPADLLRLLAHDATPAVRLSALLHPNCPDSTRAASLDELPALLAEVTALPALDPAAAAALTRAVEAIISG